MIRMLWYNIAAEVIVCRMAAGPNHPLNEFRMKRNEETQLLALAEHAE